MQVGKLRQEKIVIWLQVLNLSIPVQVSIASAEAVTESSHEKSL